MDTKIMQPAGRRGTVERSALLARLVDAREPVVSVVAPAGYGKTSLLTQWSARTPRAVAWFSLDRDDNDPAVLLACLGAALAGVGPVDDGLVRATSWPGLSVAAAVARRAATALAALGEPVTVVLDHAEVLVSPDARDVVAELAVRLPPNAQLAVASRDAPPLPLGLLRAQGAALEIGIDDLVMDATEARELLDGVGDELAGTDAEDVVRRTEGWPVGIYLAALALRAGKGRSAAAISFAGDDRAVADYLRSELLARVSPDRRSFLTRTSMLDRMCGPLCDAVLTRTSSGRMLEELEGSNLMLVPLDRRREWYRYHRLFQDLLHAELLRDEQDVIVDLHRRAAAWCEANGAPEMAIYHAQAAGDAGTLERLVTRLAIPTYAAGRHRTVDGWLAWFDDRDLIGDHPAMAVLGAVVRTLLGQPGDAERWAAIAEACDPDGVVLADGSPMDAWLALLRAFLARDGMARVGDDARAASAGLAPGSSWQPAALQLEGLSLLLCGDPDGADGVFARVVALGEDIGAHPAVATGLAERAIIAIGRQEWGEADHLAARSAAVVRAGHLEDYAQSGLPYAVSARTAVHRGDLVAARLHLAAVARLRPLLNYALPHYSVQTLLELVRAYLALADRAGARELLRQVRDILLLRPDLGSLAEEAAGLRERLDAVEAGPVGASSLTTAELRLIPFLSTHLTFPQIGERLFVSRHTVKTQAVSIYRKLGVTSRGEAIDRVEALGLLGR